MITRLIAALLLTAGIALPFTVLAAQQQAQRGAAVAVGDIAPDFTLEDQNGRKFTLSAELKTQPVVLIFYRGYW